jgi:type IV secretory pathway VirB3-like protein
MPQANRFSIPRADRFFGPFTEGRSLAGVCLITAMMMMMMMMVVVVVVMMMVMMMMVMKAYGMCINHINGLSMAEIRHIYLSTRSIPCDFRFYVRFSKRW